ncbi:MAG: ribonucleoside-diphosphate reductase [Actinomycetota bacterium]|nr:ribonucleoside-diphosphate reductase [Actinomycetota bacterium]
MAIAPEQIGIGIRRQFTVAGQDPYDSVVWERRDARISHYATGAVAFEQSGVEVPSGWSLNATNILAQKYFRGTLGSSEREWSLRQVADRVVDTITAWGRKDGYFVDDEEAQTFSDELKYLIIHQKAAFNSPVWFNIGVAGVPQQGSACFILSVEDSMDSILEWYKEEGVIFKGGSGAGVNLSRIRSSKEHLRGGGTASGPVSFMRGADASAGTIKSGGKTRRAAKMVILNVDHPDIEDFIWCKAVEERKARALRDAGFDMDLDGKDSHSIQYQNANNSIRVTDEFMHAVVVDAEWDLKAVITGEAVQTVRARDLFRQMAKATWECADPGMQFDTTINRWHTAPNSGRINGSNPCFTGDALVHTDKGLICFKELFARANEGESFGVWTHDATNSDHPQERLELTTPEAFMITGSNEVVRLRFDNGMEVRCTPGHRLFTTNRGYVEAGELTREDHVKILELPAPAVSADHLLPVSTDLTAYRQSGDHRRPVNLPEKWSPELGHYLGWLVGDGSVAATGTIIAIYGSPEERQTVLPRHSELVTWLNGGQTPKPSMQPNGMVHQRLSRQRLSRQSLTAFLAALGLSPGRGPTKRVPASIFQAPSDIVGSFLQGLFDADGCVRGDDPEGGYVGLGSSSRGLLVDVQRLLTTLGVTSSIDATTKSAKADSFANTRMDATTVSYDSSAMYDLRIWGSSVATFATTVGFVLPSKADALAVLVSGRVQCYDNTDNSAHMVERADDGYELTYNLTEPRNHSYMVNGLLVRNCSEYMHVDNSACNLASLNLLTFIEPDGPFDVIGFKAATEVVFSAQEIIVGNADYPTEAIAENSRRFRQLGIGYANLGALLMAEGLAYDSDGGRAWAGAITSLLTGHAYATSARTAARMGPFAGFTQNRDATLGVLRMHRDAAAHIDEELVPPELLSAAQEAWDDAVEIADEHGVRNAQSSVLAPTGTIGLLMDCDTTGIEPDLGLVKMKKLVGGGTMSIVNQTVPRALTRLGYDDAQVVDILAHIDEHKSVLGAPHLASEHLDVFACSMGDNTIHYRGHVRMMAAVQPFISGAISKTVNMPEEASVDDVEQLHIEAWQLGLKAVAIYRDNCKVAQPLATAKRTAVDPHVSEAEAHDAELAVKVAELEQALARQTTVVVKQPIRERMPRRRRSSTFAFRVADCEGFVTVGEYDDGRPGEVFMKVAKQGSTLAGIMDAFAISVSLGLQHGVPLSTYVKKYTSMRFEPAGMTDDPELRIAQSLVDYIFRRLAVDYMGYAERLELGVLTSQERTQPTLPGVDEAVTANQSIVDDRLDLDGHSGPSTRAGGVVGPVTGAGPVVPPAGSVMPEAGDAPYCYQCGVQMQRAGSCHACPSCGTTSGCS